MCGGGLAQEYRLPVDTPGYLSPPPHSQRVQAFNSSLQGGLVDLRYGQACVEQLGVGYILDYKKESLFTLDGQATTPEKLAKLVKEGLPLSVAVRYSGDSGTIGWFDAMSSEPMPAVALQLSPETSLPLPSGSTLRVTVPPSEIQRLDLREPTLSIPGVAHGVPLFWEGSSLRADIPTSKTQEWRRLPIFLRRVDGAVLRGPQLSLSSRGPSLREPGPIVASSALSRIPCWVYVDGPPDLLDHRATKLRASEGAKVSGIVSRPGRLDFWLETAGPGTYWVEVKVKDVLGRRASCLRAVEVVPHDD